MYSSTLADDVSIINLIPQFGLQNPCQLAHPSGWKAPGSIITIAVASLPYYATIQLHLIANAIVPNIYIVVVLTMDRVRKQETDLRDRGGLGVVLGIIR